MEDKISLHGKRNGLTIFASIIFDLNIAKGSILSLHVTFRLYATLRTWNSCLETEIIQNGCKWKRYRAAWKI
jgi:hypothetical protein